MKTQRKPTHNSRQPLFFPFSAFPRTGPSMSLANILRHLWELSHGDSLSAGGSPVSGMAALPAAVVSRGQQRGVFFSPLQGNDDTVSQWPRWVVSSWRHSPPPRKTHLPRHYTRTQASLWRWKSLSYYVTQSQECGRLKNVLTSGVTPSLSQKPGGLQGTLLSCDCAFFGR